MAQAEGVAPPLGVLETLVLLLNTTPHCLVPLAGLEPAHCRLSVDCFGEV